MGQTVLALSTLYKMMGKLIGSGTHVSRFVDDAYAIHKITVEGPRDWYGWTLGELPGIRDKIYSAYDQGLTRLEKRDVPIGVVGWSRGAVLALEFANTLNKRDARPVAFLGLYDPVDQNFWIDDTYTRQAQTGGVVVGVASREGSNNKDYKRYMPRLLDLTEEQAESEDEISGVEGMLLDATHGALGGIPGYNDTQDAKDRGEDPGPDYNYQVDVSNSIKADNFIRDEAYGAGIVIRTRPPYLFPDTDPQWPEP